MFLKSLDINGFKSFADKTHIDFAEGITSLLGPNGCGKSNIVDSIKWVLGEQSTKTLRAGKMEDVIFNGTDSRKPLQFAEVALTLDNSERKLATDMTEIEIKRRIFRSGESEYYINKNRCLLKNIRELFFDTGVGKSAYSILEQGKIDQILSQKPEDRRYIFEEAAGISRFKAECNEAQRKIERTDENINEVEILNRGEKRRYETLKTQAEKAQNYNALTKRQLILDAQVHISKLKAYVGAKTIRGNQSESYKSALDALKASLDDHAVIIASARDAVTEAASKSTSLQYAINRAEEQINSKNSAISMLEDRFREYLQSKRTFEDKAAAILSNLDRDRSRLDELKADLDEKLEKVEESKSQLENALSMIEKDQAAFAQINDEIETQNNLIIEKEAEIEMLSASLKNVIEELALELDEKMGDAYSTSKRAGAEKELMDRFELFISRIKAKLDFYNDSAADLPNLTTHIREDLDDIYASFIKIEEAFKAYKATIPPFIDTLLSPEGLLTQKRAISEKEDKDREAIANARRIIAEKKELGDKLSLEIENLKEIASQLQIQAASIEAGMESSKEVVSNLERSIEERSDDYNDALISAATAEKRSKDVQEQLRANDAEKKELNEKIKALKAELQEVMEDLKLKNADLSKKEQDKNDAVERIGKLSHDIESNEMWISQLDDNIANLYTNFYNLYSRNLEEFRTEFDNDDLPEQILLENELNEVRGQIKALGTNINHMAVDDFEEAKKQYDFYTQQLDDLYKAKADLEQVLSEIQARSEELFLTTYKQISANFQEMFRRLFGGGRAEITLNDPENVLTSGIDIFAQPPGKKLISLTLLSGGERSMTAVALLFATYMVKPSPFCILDEIDAALDDKNIGFFLSVLEDFAKDSQFIIITHNTHTVMGSSSLLGVTQMEAGVSTTISYKIANRAGEAVILNDDDVEVKFDEEGRQK